MDLNTLCHGCFSFKGSQNPCPYCGYEEGVVPESLLHLPAGTVLQGKYLLGRVLGQGGFGITYLGWDNILKLKLAISPESMGRLVEDDLSLPSTLDIRIDNKIEATLLKALAVKVEDRYQVVEELLAAMVALSATGLVRVSSAFENN